MCTLTWFTVDDGFELFFNRDESIERQIALPPKVLTEAETRIIAPTDADAGGTWISVNEFGVAVCLLNHYQFQAPVEQKAWVSRGWLVRKLSSVATLAEAETVFAKLNLWEFRAFRMFVMTPAGNNALFVWNGQKPRTEKQVNQPKTSTAVDWEHVKANRKHLYAQSVGFMDTSHNAVKRRRAHLAYHRSHDPAPSSASVCMHRHDANTVSLSHIVVNAESASFSYADGLPCSTSMNEAVVLPRALDVSCTEVRVSRQR